MKQRKIEMEKEAELASKYRDRAKERRAHQDDEGEGDKETTEKVERGRGTLRERLSERGAHSG